MNSKRSLLKLLMRKAWLGVNATFLSSVKSRLILMRPTFLFNYYFLMIIMGSVSFSGRAQNEEIQIPKAGFEEPMLKPWEATGNDIQITTSYAHSGNQSLMLGSGSQAQVKVKLKPLSKYILTGWLKTESGSDEVRLNVMGLGEHNVGTASALANWKKVEVEFMTGAGQSQAFIEIYNPANTAGNSAWADDLELKYTGEYTPSNVAGIKPLPQRIPKTDLNIEQQPNEKLEWLLDAKFGMFIHWGLYAGPGQGEWYMEHQGMKHEEYRKLAYPESSELYFAADSFSADAWASLAEQAGMKYMVLTTMHHDGYALFESSAINAFTSMQTHNRDFVKEYVDACRSHDLKVGFYKTLINWRYPGYYDVSGTGARRNKFGYTTSPSHKENARLMKNELYAQVNELMTNYGDIDIIFWDGGWLGQQGSDADGAYFWESGKYLDPENEWPVIPCYQEKDEETGKPLGLMGMVRKFQPDVIVNSRTGWMGDFKSEEGGHPVNGPIRSEDVWEKCMTMASGWGYTSSHDNPARVISSSKVQRMLADCAIRNISLLLNVGPDRHGNITRAEQNVLLQVGKWLDNVGEAMYGTRGGPWNPKDGEFGYTFKDNTIYIYLLEGFQDKQFVIPKLNKGQKVVKAWSVTDGNTVSFERNMEKETILSGFKKADPVVTILAVELNKHILDTNKKLLQ